MIDQRPSESTHLDTGTDTGIDQAPSPADIAAAAERVGRVDFTRRLGHRRSREESSDTEPATTGEGEDAHLLILPPAKVEAILAAETAKLEAESGPAAAGGHRPDHRPDQRSDRTPDLDVGQSVEEVAASIIASMRTIEENHHRHLEALEAEATRRYELLLAQAELDAELIRLNGRREAHRIIATARARTGDSPPRAPESARLQEIGETFTRFAESIESAAGGPHDPDDGTT